MCIDCVEVPGSVGVSVVDEDQPPQPSSNTVAAKLRIVALLVTKVAWVICEVRPLEETIHDCKPIRRAGNEIATVVIGPDRSGPILNERKRLGKGNRVDV